MHLPEGYTKVRLSDFNPHVLIDGLIEWDIPTATIPPRLRNIGSCFRIVRDPHGNITLSEVRNLTYGEPK